MRLYAIRFARHFKWGTYNVVFKDCEDSGKIEDFSFFYYLAEYKDRYLLFDTGFRDEETAHSMGVDFLPVEEEMQHIFGGMPDVDTVVLTHNHWDHLNNLDLYPDARIVMSEESYQEALRECGRETVRRVLRQGKIVLVKNERWIDEKFHMRVIGGHSSGSSVVCFKDGEKTFVLTGDECYICDNLYFDRPIGMFVNEENNKNFISEAHEKKWIPLPCHDSKILEMYERVSENIARIL